MREGFDFEVVCVSVGVFHVFSMDDPSMVAQTFHQLIESDPDVGVCHRLSVMPVEAAFAQILIVGIDKAGDCPTGGTDMEVKILDAVLFHVRENAKCFNDGSDLLNDGRELLDDGRRSIVAAGSKVDQSPWCFAPFED